MNIDRKKELETRLRFTLEYEINEYSTDLQKMLIKGIKTIIDNEILAVFVSSISKQKVFYSYKFYLEVNAKGIQNQEVLDIPKGAKSNLKYRKEEERWSIIDKMISEDSHFYSDPEILIDSKTNKRIPLENHILFLIKKGDFFGANLTLYGLYPKEWLKNPDIIEDIIKKYNLT